MPTFVAFGSLGVALLTFLLGILHNPKWYYISALMMYIFSFMTGFSIGYYVLSVTFVLLALALVHSIVKVKRSVWNVLLSSVALIVGYVFWLIISSYIPYSQFYWPVVTILRQFGL
ncbi:hypothetical protein REC12_10560 [Desulfosporosinus sp. PR]|uniref:hypothetical protein n=1 Tax=Candidatus Desulfosporosinus nitrosoreducens TaxID=3401928 RepID=UPI0027F8FDCD|nr:hypothetical protein [Desulfosporosinus sp. PR]MDQ7094030.1 hypothetical protein [Desulfosporosinus sp. PR]